MAILRKIAWGLYAVSILIHNILYAPASEVINPDSTLAMANMIRVSLFQTPHNPDMPWVWYQIDWIRIAVFTTTATLLIVAFEYLYHKRNKAT